MIISYSLLLYRVLMFNSVTTQDTLLHFIFFFALSLPSVRLCLCVCVSVVCFCGCVCLWVITQKKETKGTNVRNIEIFARFHVFQFSVGWVNTGGESTTFSKFHKSSVNMGVGTNERTFLLLLFLLRTWWGFSSVWSLVDSSFRLVLGKFLISWWRWRVSRNLVRSASKGNGGIVL